MARSKGDSSHTSYNQLVYWNYKERNFRPLLKQTFGNWPLFFVQVLKAGTGAVFALELLLVIDFCSTIPSPVFKTAIKCD